MARVAWPASGSPAASSRAGPPGRSRANGRAAGSRRARSPAIARPSRTGAGIRPRTGRPAAAAASITAVQPSGAATRSPGRENAAMTRAAAWAVTGPGQGPYGPLRGAGRSGQILSGTPGPVRPAAGPPGSVPCPSETGSTSGLGPLCGYGMAAGPACRRFLADVYINRVCGAFFHAAPGKIFGSPKSRGMRSGKNFFRQPGLGRPFTRWHGPGMYLRWTRDVPGPRIAQASGRN